jgi:hypothetical protein
MINNSVKNWYGETIGFRCFKCEGVFPSMWGSICNKCREQERLLKELFKKAEQKQVSDEQT